MPRLRQIVKTSYIEEAQRLRRCSRNKSHEIPRGERCLVVEENMRQKSYCRECAEEIMAHGIETLEQLRSEL